VGGRRPSRSGSRSKANERLQLEFDPFISKSILLFSRARATKLVYIFSFINNRVLRVIVYNTVLDNSYDNIL
jgi:hypothetical protein